MKKEKIIDYEQLDSLEKKMYDRLDDYLVINKKKKLSRKVKRFVLFWLCLVLGWLSFLELCGGLTYIKSVAEPKNICFVSIFAGFSCAFLSYRAISDEHEKAKLPERSPQAEHIERIIAKDGLQAVYEDFVRAKKLKDAEVMVGGKYIFAAREGMARIADVEDITVSTTVPARVSVMINDETGDSRLNISAYEDVCGEEQREKLGQLADEIAGMSGFGLMMPPQDDDEKNKKYELVDGFLDLTGKTKISLFDNNKNWQKDIYRESSNKLISEDGLDAVYNDLLDTKKIKGTSIYVGRRYLFVREGYVLRLEDIENIVMYSTIVRGDIYGYVVKAETAERYLTLTALPKNDKERKQLFEDIRIAVRDARLPLTGTEPGLKYVSNRDHE